MKPAPDLEILLVDDEEGHTELVRRNFRRIGIDNPITAMSKGTDALEYIFRRSKEDRPANRLLVLLDINMPGRVDGFEVLRRVKADPRTKNTPVIMLTTSDDPRSVDLSYELGCSSYVTKPVDQAEFREAVQRLGEFITVASFPMPEAKAGNDLG